MRIAYVTETWLPSTDGVITRLVASIAELRKLGHDILVIAPRTARPELDGVTVRTVPTMGFRFVYGGQRWGLPHPSVLRHLDDFGPDIVHLVNPVLVGAAGAVAARIRGFPTLASYHTDLVRYARDYRLTWTVPVLRTHLRVLHRSAHLNLATSATGQEQLRSHGIGESEIWPVGVDLEAYRPADAPVGPRSHPDEKPSALYVGRVSAEKGLDGLAPLAASDSPYRLTIVGDGPARAGLETAFGPRVRFLGMLRGVALAQAYRSADVFVFPSTTETLGLVLLEALASGLPVVAFDSPASRQVLAGCPAARLVVPARPEGLIPAIDDLLTAGPRQHVRGAAREWVEQKGWPAATSALLEHYRSAIAIARTARRHAPMVGSLGPQELPEPGSPGRQVEANAR